MQGRPGRPFQRRRLRYDPTFNLEANYAVEHGIAWHVFVRDWTLEDRALLAAVQLEKSEKCSNCGVPEREFLEDPDAYRAVQVVCPWCAMKDRVRSGDDTDHSQPGASVRLVTREAAEAMENTPARRPLSRRELKQ